MRRFRYLILLLVVLLSLVSGARNVILFIGDGMGPNQVSIANYVYYKNTGENLIFFDFPFLSFVDTNNASNQVTDSAAAATSFAIGLRTNNGIVGLDQREKVQENVSEKAKSLGKSVGIVTDTSITDATPAAFVAHTNSRRNSDVISAAFLDLQPDVFMGMGLSSFTLSGRSQKGWDNRDLIKELQDLSYQVVYDRSSMDQSTSPKLAGFFNNISYAFTQRGPFRTQPNLKEMTKKSLEILSQNENGFFLMVEAAVIDGSGHNNDVVGTIYDVWALEEAVKEALLFREKHPETLIIVTADHETGGMTLDPNTFPLLLERLSEVTRITPQIESMLGSSPTLQWARYVFEDSGIEVKEADLQTIVKATSGRAALVGKAITKYVGGAKYSTTGHSSQRVQLFAVGKGADRIPKELKNYEFGKLLAQFVTEE
ncbi:MAG: alkaline phosphatase [Bacillota bacterium]